MASMCTSPCSNPMPSANCWTRTPGSRRSRAQVAAAYRQWQKLAQARTEYETHAAQRNAEREQLQWQVQELEQLALQPGEWDAVQAEHTRLAHAAGLIEGVQAALDTLSEADAACLPLLSGTGARLEALLGYDARLREALELIRSGETQVQEAVYALRHYADRVELDPQRLAAVEARMEAIHGSARKFRLAPPELPDHLRRLQARLAELEIASNLEALVKQEQQARTSYFELAARLSAGRKKAAAKLGKEVTQAMQQLAMAGGKFEVALTPYPPEGSVHGVELVEFLVAANPGVEPRALARVASGGELSRISLAIQVITSKAALVPTLIFDEVDAGIGGGVAEIVGRQLKDPGARTPGAVRHAPAPGRRAGRPAMVGEQIRRRGQGEDHGLGARPESARRGGGAHAGRYRDYRHHAQTCSGNAESALSLQKQSRLFPRTGGHDERVETVQIRGRFGAGNIDGGTGRDTRLRLCCVDFYTGGQQNASMVEGRGGAIVDALSGYKRETGGLPDVLEKLCQSICRRC